MLLKLWTSEPTTLIFVTHDLREAIYLSDRIVFLSKSPSKVLFDTKVSLDRPRCFDNEVIEEYRKKISQHTKGFWGGEL